MQTLPAHLRREVALYLHREMISKVPFFHDADTSFISSLVQALRPLCAAPQDFIITVGETVFEMFFVDFGGVEVGTRPSPSPQSLTRPQRPTGPASTSPPLRPPSHRCGMPT